MSNDCHEVRERLNDDEQIVYRLERADECWFAIVRHETAKVRHKGIVGGWTTESRAVRTLDGPQKPVPAELTSIYNGLRDVALNGETIVEDTLEQAVEYLETDE
jgi:hypothetical protein